MMLLILGAVVLLSLANGSNDNFKGVVTLWGAGSTDYKRALAWGTGFTFLGSLAAMWVAGGLAAKFNGSNLVGREIYTQGPFLAAVVLAAAGTVLLASRMGLPISTTHALTGALAGAGVAAAGYSHTHLAVLGRGVVLPLLFSPLAALGLTLAVHPALKKLEGSADCVCLEEPQTVALAAGGPSGSATASVSVAPALRWASASECETGAELARFSLSDALHWLSGAAISFARGMNDTPKIVATLLVLYALGAKFEYLLVAAAMAIGGVVGAARVARTMSTQITPMAASEAVSANLVSAALVMLASFWALPLSTTHVTSGGLFGIGLMRRGQADWRCVREIVLSWVATLPIGALLAAGLYLLLPR